MPEAVEAKVTDALDSHEASSASASDDEKQRLGCGGECWGLC